MAPRLGIRLVAIALASVAYILGCHWLMTQAHASPWNAVGVLTPMLAAIAIGAWRAGQHLPAGLAALAIGGLCAQALFGVQVPPPLLYLAQHAGIHLFLAGVFGSTLRAGHTPLITTLARRVHRRFTPEMAAYTRKCTIAWVGYFVAMAVASVVLYAFAAFDTWALFANLVTPVTLAAMFGAEYLLRYRLHPEFERASFADAIRSYLHKAAD
ncbi:MAG TPA: hypothetical protein VFA35_05010 [Burkholderiaceae bacterium]|nr:hypothetical protein [Burkholderiaceae bacterium]